MSRVERMRGKFRRAYGTSRDRVLARSRARGEGDGALAPSVHPEPVAEGPREPPAAPGGHPIDDAVPRSLRIAAAWSWRLIVVGAVAYALLWVVGHYLILVAPLMIGLLLAGLLAPAMGWLLKLRVNRSLAALIVLVGGLAAVGGTITLVVNQVVAGLDDLVDSAEAGIREIETWLRTGPLEVDEADLANLSSQAGQWVNENRDSLTQGVIGAASTTVQVLSGVVLTLVVTFFFLRDGGRIWSFLVSMLPAPARAPAAYAGEGAWHSLGGYVRATVLVAFIDAVGIGIGLWILDVPLAVPLAALVFLGAFIPIVGAFVTGTLAVLVGLVDDGFIKALLVLGVVLLVQQIEGNILQPLIMSRAVKIHPLAIIVAVTFGILLAGIIGALVAVPVVAVLNTVVRRLNNYRRPPPIPVGEIPIPAA